jgi:hypothetical protein
MNNLRRWFPGTLFFFLSICIHAQFESYPCKCCNTGLKDLFKGEVLKSIYIHGCEGPGLGDLSSSFLLPSGTPPKIIESNDGPPDDAAYVKWTCRYSVGNISDNDPKTAWVEGVEGQGIGEVLIVPCLDFKRPVRIWAGYGKSDEVFMSNSRPKTIRAVIIRSLHGEPVQEGTVYNSLSIIAEETVSLADKNGYQNLPVPEFNVESYLPADFDHKVEYQYFLGIEIKEVYPGSKYEDTCISEITNE